LIKYLIVQSDMDVKPQEASRGQGADEPPVTTKEPLDNREEIRENSPDSSCQEIVPASNDHQAEIIEERIDENSGNDASENDDSDKILQRKAGVSSGESSYDYADMPDGWGEYEAAMKIENAIDW
jgi:hypothetical protein